MFLPYCDCLLPSQCFSQNFTEMLLKSFDLSEKKPKVTGLEEDRSGYPTKSTFLFFILSLNKIAQKFTTLTPPSLPRIVLSFSRKLYPPPQRLS